MAERLGEALLVLGTDDRRLVKGIDRARARAIKLGESFRRVGRQMSTFVTLPLVALATATARLADTQIQAERTLATVLRLSGEAAEERLEGFKKFASALQEITTVGDEVTLKNAQVAKSMGLTDDQAKRAAKNAIALAAAFGINAESAIRYTAALEQGDTTMLNRYIPTLRKFKDQTERAAEAQRILAGAFETAMEAAKVGLGPLRQMLNDLGDLGEEFGALILPALADFAGGVRKMIAVIRDLEPIQKKWLVGLAAALAAGGPILIGLGVLAAAIGALMSPIGLVIAGLAGAAGLVAWLVNTSNQASELERSTDNIVIAMGDQIQQTQQLGVVLRQNSTMTVEAAKANLALAKARFEDVRATIEQIRANALASGEFARVAQEINDMQLAVSSIVVGATDDVSRRRADALEGFQQSLANLLTARQALLDVDVRLADQERETAEQIAFLNEAIANQVNGLIALKGAIVEPITATERLGAAAAASAEIFEDEASALADVAEAHRRTEDAAAAHARAVERTSDAFANWVVNIRDAKSAMASLQSLLMRMLSQLASKGLSGLFTKLFNSFIGSGGGGSGGITAGGTETFAHGGSFTVGGRSGVDNNLVQFRASRGERVDITPAGKSSGSGVVVQIINNTPAQISEERGTGPNGEDVRKFVIQQVGDAFGRGDFDAQQRARFGVAPQRMKR